jgi:hypothetical protein
MRWLLVTALLLTGCGPGLKFDKSQMAADQMLDRASLVFVGVIERHIVLSWPFLSIPGEDSKYWRVVDMRVRIEAIARGEERRKVVDVYEFVWVGGTSGDWNLTQDNHRYLFLVRLENGRYHVVRDWWRSIFPIGSGGHDRFPLDSSRPLWERATLLQLWVAPGWNPGMIVGGAHLDPGQALGPWRLIKLLRGFLRYPDGRLRVAACESLLIWGRSQDECYDQLDSGSIIQRGTYWNGVSPAEEWSGNRRWEKEFAEQDWERLRASKNDRVTLDEMKLFTTVSNPEVRRKFCRLFGAEFPDDHDNGCPADQPLPATIVTADGDVPLRGDWPVNSSK